jgi:hypothetical protein
MAVTEQPNRVVTKLSFCLVAATCGLVSLQFSSDSWV